MGKRFDVFMIWLIAWGLTLSFMGWLAEVIPAKPKLSDKYPVALKTWAEQINARIDGAQCESAGNASVCDVRMNSGTMAKVSCAGDKCWLKWSQGDCPK